MLVHLRRHLECRLSSNPSSSDLFFLQLWRFALRFIHSHGDATGVFRNVHSWEIVALTTSGNRVRHIVSSQDGVVTGTLITPDQEQDILNLEMDSILIFLVVNPPLSACERRSC